MERELHQWRTGGGTSRAWIVFRRHRPPAGAARLFFQEWRVVRIPGVHVLAGASEELAAVLGALDRPHVTGPFNVANDGTLTTREFLELFAAGLGVPFHPIHVPRALVWGAASVVDAATRRLRPGAPMTTLKTAVQFLANPNPYVSGRAERELGWRPVVAPRDAVWRTACWFRERGY